MSTALSKKASKGDGASKKRKPVAEAGSAQKPSKKSSRLSSPISMSIFDSHRRTELRKYHESSQPYKHVFINGICDVDRMKLIHEEVKNNMSTTFKESDLFKLFQTVDLSNIDASNSNIPQLVSLRESIYSKEFRQLVTDITGCGDLTDRVDLSINAYTQGCHLLCHDDVISTRRISYIIYLADPEDDWSEADGGLLELYPIDPASQSDMGPDVGIQGVPLPVPTNFLVPKFNTMAFFVVQPGRSYHAVQEVFADKPRVSISGWYHGEAAPLGADMASLGQIMKKGEEVTTFTTIPFKDETDNQAIHSNAAKKAGKRAQKKRRYQLTDADMTELRSFINSEYLKKSIMKDINLAFCSESSIQLKDFLKADLAETMRTAMIAADRELGLGGGARPDGYDLGAKCGWDLVGPPHLRRHLRLSADGSSSDEVIGSTLLAINAFFGSAAFAKYLRAITSLSPLETTSEVRRFRPGLDYTVAHYGTMTAVPKLDTTLCFVLANQRMLAGPVACVSVASDEVGPTTLTGSAVVSEEDDENDSENDNENDKDTEDDDEEGENEGGKDDEDNGEDGSEESDSDESDEDEEEEEGDNDSRDLWSSGDVGGFECYVEADDESPEASEVYMTANKQEKETSLLSVSAGFNVLNVVLRDQRVMRFVKYVSAQAPSSRWDVSAQFVLEQE